MRDLPISRVHYRGMSLLWFLITTIIGGAVLGGIAQLLIPGKSRIPAWATVVAGIVGAAAGSIVYYALFGLSSSAEAYNVTHPGTYNWENTTKGIDWMRHLWQIGASVVAVTLTGGLFATMGKART